MKKIIFFLLLLAIAVPVVAQVPPGPHWVVDKWMYIVKGVMTDSNIYSAQNHKHSLGLPAGIDVGPRWWRALYVDSIFTNWISTTTPIMTRFDIMDSLAKYANSNLTRDTIPYYDGILAGQLHFVGGVRNVILGGLGDTISDGAGWTDSTRNSAILAGVDNEIMGSNSSVVLGGDDNWDFGDFSATSGGRFNWILAADSDCIIDGGYYHTIFTGVHGSGIFVGDTNNIINATSSAIVGGAQHVLGPTTSAGYSVILGGLADTLDGDECLIGASYGCYIAGRSLQSAILASDNSDLGSAAVNSAIIATSNSTNDAFYSAIVGGLGDTILTDCWNDGIYSSQGSVVGDTGNVIVGGGLHRLSTAGNPGECNAIVGGQGHTMDYINGWNFIGGGYSDTTAYVMWSGMVGGIANRIDTASFSFIGAGSGNYIYGSANGIIGGNVDTIAYVSVSCQDNFIGAGLDNWLSGLGNSISGGGYNTIFEGQYCALEGGYLNSSMYGQSVNSYNEISGGFGDTIYDGQKSGIVAGSGNRIDWISSDCFIGGGEGNRIANGLGDAIVGGIYDTIFPYRPADASFIGSGYDNYTEGYGTGIVGGIKNDIILASNYSGIFVGDSNQVDQSISSGIFAGDRDTIDGANNSALIAGVRNMISSPGNYGATITGGNRNFIQINYGNGCQAIEGGRLDTILGAELSAILAGYKNRISNASVSAIVGGGTSVIEFNGTGTCDGIFTGNADTVFDAAYSVILGGNSNYVATTGFDPCYGAAIVGGLDNTVTNNSYSVIAGGQSNYINTVNAKTSCGILGGIEDSLTGSCGAIIGGQNNHGGGGVNDAVNSVIVGGSGNKIYGNSNTIVAGLNDTVGGVNSFCFGEHNVVENESKAKYNFLGGLNNVIRNSTNNWGDWACGNASLVDTSHYSFAFNTTITKYDSVLAVCKEFWVRGLTTADTSIITGRHVYSDTAAFHQINWGVDAQGSDDYVVTIPGIQTYYTGLMITFSANTANTGAATVAVNGGAAKALKAFHDQDPPDNYIEAGSIVMAVYDGTNFQMIQPDANP